MQLACFPGVGRSLHSLLAGDLLDAPTFVRDHLIHVFWRTSARQKTYNLSFLPIDRGAERRCSVRMAKLLLGMGCVERLTRCSDITTFEALHGARLVRLRP